MLFISRLIKVFLPYSRGVSEKTKQSSSLSANKDPILLMQWMKLWNINLVWILPLGLLDLAGFRENLKWVMTYLTGWKLATSPIARKHRHQFINLDIFSKDLRDLNSSQVLITLCTMKNITLLYDCICFNHTETLFFHWGNILPYWSSIWGLCVPWVYEGFWYKKFPLLL